MGLRFASNEIRSRAIPAPPHLYVQHDNESEFVMLMDAKGVIVAANSEALRLLGCTEEEAIGTYYGCFFKTLHFQPEGLDGSGSQDGASDSRSAARIPRRLTVFGFAQRADGSRYPMEAKITFGRAGQDGWDATWSGAVLTAEL